MEVISICVLRERREREGWDGDRDSGRNRKWDRDRDRW